MAKKAIDLSMYSDSEINDLIKELNAERDRRGHYTKTKVLYESGFWTGEKIVHWEECVSKRMQSDDIKKVKDVLSPFYRVRDSLFTVCDFTLGNFKVKDRNGAASAFQNGSIILPEMYNEYLEMYTELSQVVDKYIEKGVEEK